MKGHLCSWGEQCPLFKTWHKTMARRVHVFYSEKTVDSFTVFINRTERGVKVWDIYTMSENPSSPQGVDMYSHTISNDEYKARDTRHDGKAMKVIDCPQDVIRAIEHRI